MKQRKKRYNPSETSHDEETMEQEEAESRDTEPHPPNNNNNNASFVRLSLFHKALETVFSLQCRKLTMLSIPHPP